MSAAQGSFSEWRHEKTRLLSEKDNVVFARLMDAGKLPIARISKVTKRGSFTQISIGIYLIDF